MNENLKSELWQIYGSLLEVAEETIQKLGEDKARRFFDLSTDWVDIQNDGLPDAYSSEELHASLVYLDFVGLFKELRWLQLLLFSGNYPLIYRNLRYQWELVFRSFYADLYHSLFPDRHDGPAEDKAAWLEERETRLNWDEVMKPVLQCLLPAAEHLDIEDRYKTLWRKLHKFVHASTEIRNRMIDESNLLLVDNYDDTWAREAIQDGTEVFDLIWLAVLKRFPACVPLLQNSLTCKYCTKVRAFLQKTGP